MLYYKIHKLEQFTYNPQTRSLDSLSPKTVKEIISLPLDTKIIINIHHMPEVKFINQYFMECDEFPLRNSLDGKLCYQVCKLVISNMYNLQYIHVNAFKNIGYGYEDSFTFEIFDCPKLHTISKEAFQNVAFMSTSLEYDNKSLEKFRYYTLQFVECKLLSRIYQRAFQGFGYFAQNCIGINLSFNTNLIHLYKSSFEQAFYKSSKFSFIYFGKLPYLNLIDEFAFKQCGNDSKIDILVTMNNMTVGELKLNAFDKNMLIREYIGSHRIDYKILGDQWFTVYNSRIN